MKRRPKFLFLVTLILVFLSSGYASGMEVKNERDSAVSPETPRTFNQKKTLPGGISVDFSMVSLAKYKKDIDGVFKYVFSETERIAALFNTTDASSELAKIADSAGNSPVAVSKETFVLAKHAKEVADWTKGAYNPVVGGSYNALKIDKKNSTVYLTKKGAQLDFSGILAGFLADLYIRAAYHANVDDAFVQVDGCSRSMGKESSWPWQVTLTGKSDKFAKSGINLAISNYSICTVGGQYPAPTVDPRTGKPILPEFYSVTILTKQSATSEAVADSVYTMGHNAGLDLINGLGIKGVFAYPDGRIEKVGRW